MLTERDIRRIAGCIANAYRPHAVGTFGSYAIGRPTDRSDLDLFIIRRNHGAPPLHAQAVNQLLFDVLYPLDVLVFTPAEFEDSVYEYQSFTWVIARQARLYHWDSEAEQAVPSLVPAAAASPDDLEQAAQS